MRAATVRPRPTFSPRFVLPALVLAWGLLAAVPGLAWDGATTHAGMTRRALAASRFHAVLAHQLGRPLGILEPLRLDLGTLNPDVARALKDRLDALDAAGGYRPSADDVATSGAWVEAGAVLSMTPPERARNHFFDPENRRGLDDGPGLAGTVHAVRLTVDQGATLRDAATGQAFALDGMSAPAWLEARQNDLGLLAFLDDFERSVSAPQPRQRETALVRALLALGGMVAVLEDAGQPAFVRNDFRGEFLSQTAGSVFERYVAEHYGTVALPPAGPAVMRPTLASFFAAADHKGLAQTTQQRFFSPGTLPDDFEAAAGDTSTVAERVANQSLKFPLPKVSGLALSPSESTRYVRQDGLRVLAYQRIGNRLHFFLDEAVYADSAKRWLPEVEGYAAGMIDYLLRGKVEIAVANRSATFNLAGLEGTIEAGAMLHVFSERADGSRREIAVRPLSTGAAIAVEVPADAKRVAAFVRSRDGGGALFAAGEKSL